MTSRVFLALGTNLGQRRENLQRAVYELAQFLVIEALSPIYQTAPWGVADQPHFLNMCLSGLTALSPKALLTACKDVEKQIGRLPGPRWGPRLLDIDLLFYDRLVLETADLKIPHPHLAERAFVLLPLNDIAAELVHPITKMRISEHLAGVDTSTAEKLKGPDYLIYRPRSFIWGLKTFVMGILNATPDSFSGDGLVGFDGWIQSAADRAQEFEKAGADIIDIGGQSTRPGSDPVSPEEEIERVIPVIKAVRQSVTIPISIDTFWSSVARQGLDVGAGWVNDVWGLHMDKAMVDVVAETGCPVVLMHNRSKPKNVDQQERLGGRYVGIEYDDLIADIKRELGESIQIGLDHGVKESQIIVDPGIGFGKTVVQNLLILRELSVFSELGFPLLVGPSRKSFIGYTLDLPLEERLEGTAAAVAIAIEHGADIVRVHDVKEMVRLARMTDAIVRS